MTPDAAGGIGGEIDGGGGARSHCSALGEDLLLQSSQHWVRRKKRKLRVIVIAIAIIVLILHC